MLTQLLIKRFKQFEDVSIELGNPVVFVGPNNSGKTTALQALALWAIGVQRWSETYGDRKTLPKKRRGIVLNRQDLLAMPIPSANLLWLDKRTHYGTQRGDEQKTKTIPHKIEIGVEGITNDRAWSYRLEFDYANNESIYCRPPVGEADIPSQEAAQLDIAYLPPMSGLSGIEDLLPPGSINVRIGEGRTAEVLRNLCYGLRENQQAWQAIHEDMGRLFGIDLHEPRFIEKRGSLMMSYVDRKGIELDISSAGRGLQQVLLILAYLHMHEHAVLLLDEPDAHLEILRQRHIYDILSTRGRSSKAQIIVASHSEVVLREATGKDTVIAFIGRFPHRIDDRKISDLLKSLKEIEHDHYYLAELRGWVLYLEGSTDLAILQAFARTLRSQASNVLSSPFVQYVANDRDAVYRHFSGLQEAYQSLKGFYLSDRITDRNDRSNGQIGLTSHVWKRREIENYLCQPTTLITFAGEEGTDNGDARKRLMQEEIQKLVPPIALQNMSDPWWHSMKASDEFLDRLFENFYQGLNLPNQMRKTNYHLLAQHVSKQDIDPEVGAVLTIIQGVAESAITPLADAPYKPIDDEINT